MADKALLKARRTKQGGVSEDVCMSKVTHQMSATAERTGVTKGEVQSDVVSDETCGPTHDTKNTGSELLLEVLARQNLLKALKRVKANKGAADIDGHYIGQTIDDLKLHWPRIREELLAGTYRPCAVRRVTRRRVLLIELQQTQDTGGEIAMV